MFKILANLKKNWISVLFIIMLLCLQAWTDLTLPDYTSKIVNTGIQAGGIEYIAPTVIRKDKMDNILMFTDDDNEILSKYTLISKNSLSKEDYNKKVKEYPELEKQDLYELKQIDKKQKKDLDEIILNPFITVYFLENEEYSSEIKQQIFGSNVETKIPENTEVPSIIELIKKMPEETKNQKQLISQIK